MDHNTVNMDFEKTALKVKTNSLTCDMIINRDHAFTLQGQPLYNISKNSSKEVTLEIISENATLQVENLKGGIKLINMNNLHVFCINNTCTLNSHCYMG